MPDVEGQKESQGSTRQLSELTSSQIRTLAKSGARKHLDKISDEAIAAITSMDIVVTKDSNTLRATLICSLCEQPVTLLKGKRAWCTSNFTTHLLRIHPRDEEPARKQRRKTAVVQGQQPSIASAFRSQSSQSSQETVPDDADDTIIVSEDSMDGGDPHPLTPARVSAARVRPASATRSPASTGTPASRQIVAAPLSNY